MTLRFFDINSRIGLPTRPSYKPARTARELVAALRPIGADRALVWHVAQRDAFPTEGNALLARAIRSHREFTGCWTLLPPITGEVVTPDFFQQMRRYRVAALRVFPTAHRYLLNRVVFGGFLDEVSRRRIPLLLSLEAMPWEAVYGLLRDYPDLTCVLCDIGVWGQDRNFWPLLAQYPNTSVETSLLALQDGGVEATVEKFGAGRLLFGTGFPERYPEAPALQLRHCRLSETERAKIAWANAERLLSGVDLGGPNP